MVDEAGLDEQHKQLAVIARETWFSELFGCVERPAEIQAAFDIDRAATTFVAPNGRTFKYGEFQSPNVKELRAWLESVRDKFPHGMNEPLSLDHIATDDVINLHAEPANKHATFQVASQFNCLEFPSWRTVPENGIEGYIYDRTQGPACALACPAGTLFRNYLVPVGSQTGQSTKAQLSMLSDLSKLLDNDANAYWEEINGYVLIQPDKMERLAEKICGVDGLREELIAALRVGYHQDTEVVLANHDARHFSVLPGTLDCDVSELHTVSQVYSSAMSLGYAADQCEEIARVILEATYEATLLLALKNAHHHDFEESSRHVFLTFVGGGAFKNNHEWINYAIAKACAKYRHFGLKVHVVYYKKLSSDAEAITRYLDELADENSSSP